MEHNIPGCIARFGEILEEDCPLPGPGGCGEWTGLLDRFEKGLAGTEEFTDTILARSRPGTTAEDVVEAWNLMHAGIPPERITALQDLKGAGFRLYLLSNNNAIHWKDICDNYHPEMLFDDVFLSFVEHCSKPDEKIYRAVEKRTGLSAADIFFIDDRKDNREAALHIGWETCASLEELMEIVRRNPVF